MRLTVCCLQFMGYRGVHLWLMASCFRFLKRVTLIRSFVVLPRLAGEDGALTNAWIVVMRRSADLRGKEC